MVRVRPTGLSDGPTQKAVDDLRTALPDLGVFEGARALDGIVLQDGVTKRIVHGLGRKLRGWLVVRINSSGGTLLDEQATHSDGKTYLYLKAVGYSPTVSLVVF